MHARATGVQCCGDSLGVANVCAPLQLQAALSRDAVFRGSRAAAHGALCRNVRVSMIPSLPQMHCQSLQCVPITPQWVGCVLPQARLCALAALTAAAAVLNPIDGFCLATERSSVLRPCVRGGLC